MCHECETFQINKLHGKFTAQFICADSFKIFYIHVLLNRNKIIKEKGDGGWTIPLASPWQTLINISVLSTTRVLRIKEITTEFSREVRQIIIT